MRDFIIGLITTAAVIGLLEFVRFLDKRLVAAFTLVGIPFIYIGFTWHHIPSLIYSICAVAIFLALAYFGYKLNFKLIVLGLLLHGIWDLLYPFFGKGVPAGYDIFCLTVDFLLAAYFYFRVKPHKSLESLEG